LFENLSGLGYGLVTFAIMVGVGIVVLVSFSGSVAICSGTGSPVWNTSISSCQNSTGATSTPSNAAYSSVSGMATYLGTSSGGLASWTPTIIALAIGLLFLGAFMVGKGRKGRY